MLYSDDAVVDSEMFLCLSKLRNWCPIIYCSCYFVLCCIPAFQAIQIMIIGSCWCDVWYIVYYLRSGLLLKGWLQANTVLIFTIYIWLSCNCQICVTRQCIDLDNDIISNEKPHTISLVKLHESKGPWIPTCLLDHRDSEF